MKLLKIYTLLIGLLSSSTIFANTNNNLKEPNLVYCPEKVICSGGSDGDVTKSCHPDDPNKQAYVSRVMGYGNISGVHPFVKAYSYPNLLHPHFPKIDESWCEYRSSKGTITLYYSAAANLEVYYNKSTRWDMYVNYGLDKAICESTDPKSCPLFSKPELVIDKKISNYWPKININIKTMAKGRVIKIVDTKQPSYFNSYASINYDEAFVACNGEKQCPIDIYYGSDTGNGVSYYYYAGNVVVDMVDNMKILQINTGPNNNGTGSYLLKKQEPFNAVSFVN